MDREKFVDESWKENAAQEKDKISGENKVDGHSCCDDPSCDHSHEKGLMDVNFINYITSLGFQTMIFLGEIPNPVTNEVEKSLDHAKFIIDTLTMIREKTKGNLTDQEGNLLEATIYELQLKYVEVSQKENKNG